MGCSLVSHKVTSIDAPPDIKSSAPPGRIRRAIEWGGDNAFLCWAWIVIAMFVLTCASIPLGNFSVQFDGHFADGTFVDLGKAQSKEVGYISALNWSVYSI